MESSLVNRFFAGQDFRQAVPTAHLLSDFFGVHGNNDELKRDLSSRVLELEQLQLKRTEKSFEQLQKDDQ